MADYILALDLGTTGNRAILYDRNMHPVRSAYREFRQYFPKPGWVEHDPEEIWRSTLSVINKVLSSPAEVRTIGITNQRETTVVWNRKTGKPVHKAIVWQCRRTADFCERLKKNRLEQKIRLKTGLPVDAYFSGSKIRWILDNVKGTAAAAHRGDLAFGTIDSWLLWKLTGGAVHATDHTNACRTMLYNIRTLTWDLWLIKLLRVPKAMLPRILPSSGHFGETVRRGRLKAGIPISGIAGDQQAALFGQACFSPGEIKNTYGTGCFMLMNTGRKLVRSKNNLITTVCCNEKGQPAWALEGAVFIAGAAIQWLRDKLKLIASAPETDKICRSIKDTGGVYVVPAFTGLGAPWWDQYARGTICGLTRGSGQAEFIRATVESLAYQVNDLLDAMRKDSGKKIRELAVDGGASANEFLMQFQSDISGLKVKRPAVIETTSLGAACLAGLATGYWQNAAEIRHKHRIARSWQSKMKTPARKRLLEGWQNAVRRTLSS